MSSILAPRSLTQAKIRNPHRRLSNKHQNRSHLEQSFWTGSVEEIQYWIDSGVVQEAMGGKANSKINYRVNLMDWFVRSLDNRYRTILKQQEENIIQQLWEMGAKLETELHDSWLTYLVASPFRETLLEAGALCWAGRHTLENDAKREKQRGYRYEPQNGVEAAMRMLSARQVNVEKSGENELLTKDRAELEKLIDRFLDTPGHDQKTLRRALGWAAMGATSVHQKHHAQVWERWRDKLLDMGAEVVMHGNDGLQQLLSTAPKNPISMWDVNEIVRREISRRKQQAQESGETVDYLWEHNQNRTEILQDYIDKRAMSWIRVASSWIDAFEPHIHKSLSGKKISTAENPALSQREIEILAGILDVPGGEQVVLRIARIMSNAGHPMPWNNWDSNSIRLNLRSVVELQGKRSLKKLRGWHEILTDPTVLVQGVSEGFKASLASVYLGLERLKDPSQDVPSGGRVEDRNEIKHVISSIRHTGIRSISVVDKQEIELLLALSKPKNFKEMFSYIDANFMARRHWAGELFSAMGRWARTHMVNGHSSKVRKSTLEVMADHGLLDIAFEPFSGLDDIETMDKTQRDVLRINMINAGSSWMFDWLGDNACEEDLKRVLKKKAPHLSTRLAKLRACYYVNHNMTDQHEEVEPDTTLDLMIGPDRDLRDFLGETIEIYIAGAPLDIKAESLNRNLRQLYQLMRLGWQPKDPSSISNKLVKIGSDVQCEVSEVNQELIVKLLEDLGDPLEKTIGFIAQHRINLAPESERWVALVVLAIEKGADINIPPNYMGGKSGVAYYAEAALKRRELTQVAQKAVESSGGKLEQAGRTRLKM